MSLAYALNNATYEYRPFTHILNTEDNVSYLAYGIELFRHDIGTSTKVDSIKGITTRREKMEKILEILNRAQVLPSHFRDTLEDLLS